jgi:hypothetical protein
MNPGPGFSSRCITFAGRKVNPTMPIRELMQFPPETSPQEERAGDVQRKNSLAF